MTIANHLHGLVVCGGQSTRMGTDKAFLVYDQKPQCYHLADMLVETGTRLCSQVIISCNQQQLPLISKEYPALADLPEYHNCGPIASLLTAFSRYNQADFLVIGCDYPFIRPTVLKEFLESIREDSIAAAFYNQAGKYEPLLAWYAAQSAGLLKTYFNQGGRSLQHFLNEISAQHFQPQNEEVMISIDTPDAFERARLLLMNQ